MMTDQTWRMAPFGRLCSQNMLEENHGSDHAAKPRTRLAPNMKAAVVQAFAESVDNPQGDQRVTLGS